MNALSTLSAPEVLQWLWAATLICSTSLLLVLALRPLLRRHGGAPLAYTAWGLVPLALVASLLPYPNTPLPTVRLSGAAVSFNPYSGPGIATDWWQDPATMLGVWALGVFALSCWTMARQWHFQRRLGRLQPLGGHRGVWSAGRGVETGPLVLGLLRPKVVVPADFPQRYSAQEQALILAHERVHLQRGDLPAQWLAQGLRVLFWFNPLLHLALSRFRFDQEAACDAAVLQRHPEQRQAYAATLVKVQLGGWNAPLGCAWQSGHPLTARIQLLAQARPSAARRAGALGALAIATAGTCLFAWAADQAPAPPASGAAAASAGPRYRVVLKAVDEVIGKGRQRVEMELAVQSGEPVQLEALQAAPPKGLDCAVTLEVRPSGASNVDVRLPFSCAGSEVRRPRLITALGQRATIQTGSKVDGEHLYTFEVTATLWPDTTPWPR